MAKFLVLLRDIKERPQMSPAEMQRIVEKYKAWSVAVRGKGQLLDGNPLKPEGKVVRKSGGKLATTDGPFTESKEVLGGYYLIEAPSYEAMLDLMRDHPHTEIWSHGSLEIRQIADMP